jgi:small subunit ribosomal protein S8e
MLTQSKDRKKPSGGMIKYHRKKRLAERGNAPALTKIGKAYVRKDSVRGMNYKLTAVRADTANVYDPATKKFKKAKIDTVVINPANRHYTRSNIMTKGTIINTEIGKARITSRPGQNGVINAVLTKEDNSPSA